MMKFKIKKLFFTLTCALILFSAIAIKKANATDLWPHETGKWVAVYNGNSIPQYYDCHRHLYWYTCVVGTVKYPDPIH